MIDIILVDLISDYFTGIERYSEVMKSKSDHRVRIHHLVFETFKSLPTVIIHNTCFTANFYFPFKNLGIKRYKLLYYDLILNSLAPLTASMQNIIWHMNHLDLFELVQAMKKGLGGKLLLHLHCIPWKYQITKNFNKFRELYDLYKYNNFAKFKDLEKSGLEYNLADHIICLSDTARDYLVNIYQVNPNKISKIYNGINIKPFQRKKNEMTILYAGRITKDKGIFDLLDAVKEVINIGYFPKVKLVGYCHIPKHIIESKYVNIDVEILGQLSFDQLQKLYASATFGVIPSLHEQCSYVAIEMAAFGLPLIVSDVDALSEMFKNRETALFNKLVLNSDGLYADQKVFVNNIVEMIENKELRKRISTNLRKLYQEKFKLKTMYQLTFNLYESLF